MVLSKNSWHHSLACFYGPLDYYYSKFNVCDYISAMMRGLFVVLLSLSIGGLMLVAPLGDFLVWIYVGLTIGWVEGGVGVHIILAYLGGLAFVAIIFALAILSDSDSAYEYKKALVKSYINSVPYRMFHAWSNKYCFNISFK